VTRNPIAPYHGLPIEPGCRGNGAAPRASGRPGPNLRTSRGFGWFRYTQRNIAPTSVPATNGPSSPEPRNTIAVQDTTGTQITAIEVETQKACRRRPIRALLKAQSAQAVLRAPRPAASSCIINISIISVAPRSIGWAGIARITGDEWQNYQTFVADLLTWKTAAAGPVVYLLCRKNLQLAANRKRNITVSIC